MPSWASIRARPRQRSPSPRLASNLRGNAHFTKVIERAEGDGSRLKVVDLNSLKIIVPTPIDGSLDREEYEEKIDWKAFTIEEEE